MAVEQKTSYMHMYMCMHMYLYMYMYMYMVAIYNCTLYSTYLYRH